MKYQRLQPGACKLKGDRASKVPNVKQDGTMPEWEFTMPLNAATLLQFAQIFMQKTDTSIADRAAFGTWAGVEQKPPAATRTSP
jgi:hypothetical protein